jgi:hypothetical protein
LNSRWWQADGPDVSAISSFIPHVGFLRKFNDGDIVIESFLIKKKVMSFGGIFTATGTSDRRVPD